MNRRAESMKGFFFRISPAVPNGDDVYGKICHLIKQKIISDYPKTDGRGAGFHADLGELLNLVETFLKKNMQLFTECF